MFSCQELEPNATSQDIVILVEMTLRTAARLWRSLARHSVGTYISSGTLQSLFCFTSVTLVIHLFLSHSHVFHLWVTGQQSVQWMLRNWLIRAWKPASSKHSPVLWFSAKALPFLSLLCHSKSLSVLSGTQWRHSLFTINDCCPLANF